jgi:hypothetical protein
MRLLRLASYFPFKDFDKTSVVAQASTVALGVASGFRWGDLSTGEWVTIIEVTNICKHCIEMLASRAHPALYIDGSNCCTSLYISEPSRLKRLHCVNILKVFYPSKSDPVYHFFLSPEHAS